MTCLRWFYQLVLGLPGDFLLSSFPCFLSWALVNASVLESTHVSAGLASMPVHPIVLGPGLVILCPGCLLVLLMQLWAAILCWRLSVSHLGLVPACWGFLFSLFWDAVLRALFSRLCPWGRGCPSPGSPLWCFRVRPGPTLDSVLATVQGFGWTFSACSRVL